MKQTPGASEFLRLGRLAALLAIALTLLPPRTIDTAWAEPAGTPNAQREWLDPTPAQCTRFYRDWRRGPPDRDDTDLWMDACSELMGLDEKCAAQGGRLEWIWDGNQRGLYCRATDDDDEWDDQVAKIGKGVLEGLIVAGPYIALAVQAYGCYNGAIFACATMALQIAEMTLGDIPSEVGEALTLARLASACYNQDIAACVQLGEHGARAADIEIPGADYGAVVADGKRCYDGEFAACLRLGMTAADAAGLEVVDTGTVTDVKDCSDGDIQACADLGRKIAAATGLPLKDLSEAVANLNACRVLEGAAQADACIALGKAAAEAAGVHVNPGSVVDANNCTNGDIDACTRVGRSIAEVSGLPLTDMIDAVAKAEACRSKAAAEGASACMALGRAVAAGLPANVKSETVVDVSSCANNDTDACTRAGRLIADKMGLPLNGVANGINDAKACRTGERADACDALGKALVVAAAPPGGQGIQQVVDPAMPTPFMTSWGGGGVGTLSLAWDTDPRTRYSRYEINYAQKGTIYGVMNQVSEGTPTNDTVSGLNAGTTYQVSVRGCWGMETGGHPINCSRWSRSVEASTSTPPPPGSQIGSASIIASPPAVTAGGTVKVDGTTFLDGTVNVSLEVPNGSVTLGQPTVTAGSLSVTGTIPATTPPGTYKIHARDLNGRDLAAPADIQVVAAGPRGTLTVTFAGIADTNIEVDTDGYIISGANFSTRAHTIYIDSPTGPQYLAATNGRADGTFQEKLRIPTSQLGGQLGRHKLTAVNSDGVTVAELDVTILPKSGP